MKRRLLSKIAYLDKLGSSIDRETIEALDAFLDTIKDEKLQRRLDELAGSAIWDAKEAASTIRILADSLLEIVDLSE